MLPEKHVTQFVSIGTQTSLIKQDMCVSQDLPVVHSNLLHYLSDVSWYDGTEEHVINTSPEVQDLSIRLYNK